MDKYKHMYLCIYIGGADGEAWTSFLCNAMINVVMSASAVVNGKSNSYNEVTQYKYMYACI
jgi:hypothetical protein